MYYIYLLYDPESLSVRYVGVTSNPIIRKYKHRAMPDKNAKTHRDNWIRSVINRGLRPEFRIVEEVEDTEWQEAERRWIKETKEAGFDLINSTSGGDGVRDYKPSPEQLIKLRTQNIGRIRSQEFKDKLSQTNKGKAPWKAIAASKGHKVSEEGKKKLSESMLNRPKGSCIICKQEMRIDKIKQHYGFKHAS